MRASMNVARSQETMQAELNEIKVTLTTARRQLSELQRSTDMDETAVVSQKLELMATVTQAEEREGELLKEMGMTQKSNLNC